MDRLTEKLKAAGGVVARQTAKIEARADAIIAREPVLEAQTDRAFAPHEALLSEAEQGLDTLYQKLALVSNDPLGNSASQQPGSAASTEPANGDAPERNVFNG